MKWLVAALVLVIGFGASAQTMDVTLNWEAPVANTDGTPLLDLWGYKIYWGPKGGPYPDSVTIQAPVENYVATAQLLPQQQEICFVVTALNSAQRESVPSNEACKVTPDIPDVPNPPSGLTVEIVLNFGP